MLVELFSIHQIGGWAEDTGKVIQLFSSHENLKKLVELIYNYLALAEKKMKLIGKLENCLALMKRNNKGIGK